MELNKVDMSEKKILVIYFSRTGNCEKLAKYLEEKLSSDVFKVEDFDRSSVSSYWYGIYEKMTGTDNSSYLKTDGLNLNGTILAVENCSVL